MNGFLLSKTHQHVSVIELEVKSINQVKLALESVEISAN